MKRAVQLFHEVTGAREYSVTDETMAVKEFVFSVVEELRDQDKEFFEVYAGDGSRIGDRKVVDALGPYIVVCDIISARADAAECRGQVLWIRGGFHERLRSFLETFDDVETCGFLLGTWKGDAPEYVVGVFPELELQTRNDAVVGSQHVALVHLGVRNATLHGDRPALAWIHTHLDTPPRLSSRDRRTLARLRSLAPETCAMIFNQRFPDLGIVSYLSDGTRVPLLEASGAPAEDGLAVSIRDSIARVYAGCGKEPPRFTT